MSPLPNPTETDRPKYLDLLYAHYGEWKRTNFQVRVATEREIFAREFKRLKLPRKAKILEVGFGSGLFLDWAGDQGFDVEGVEISPDYVDAALDRGHKVIQGTVEDFPVSGGKQYDAIVCFDVLEHLSVEEIISFFLTVKPMLAEEGLILARFPNGGSPFGLYNQYGDATHLTALTGLKIGQLAAPAGLKVESIYNGVRPLRCGRFWGLPARMKFVLAVMIEWLLSQIYSAGQSPMGSNLTVHLRLRDDAPALHHSQRAPGTS